VNNELFTLKQKKLYNKSAMNPGIYWAYYTLSLIYLSYRFHIAGQKGSELAKDYSRFTFFFALTKGSIATGLLFFSSDPWIAAYVCKIIGFGFWYIAIASMVPILSKIVAPKASSKLLVAAALLMGVFLTIYHLFHLTPVTISAEGVPLWNIDPLITFTQAAATIGISIIIGVTFILQAIKAKHAIRGILIGGGHISAALFTPLVYAVNSRGVFLTLSILSVIAFTILIASVWSSLLNVNDVNYEKAAPISS
jgi:hypothetical protein